MVIEIIAVVFEIIAATVATLSVLQVIALAVAYAYFQHSPLKRWRDRVLCLERLARLSGQVERDELDGLGTGRQKQENALRNEAYLGVLRAVSVEELEWYPGIGPGTVAKLRQAGYADLAALQRMTQLGFWTSLNWHRGDVDLAALQRITRDIPGLGKKRLVEIHQAVTALTRQALERFQAGSYPGAAGLAASLHALETEQAQRGVRFRARAQAAERFVESLGGLVAEARRVTFVNYLWHLTKIPISRKALETPLPDLDQALDAAEHTARAANAHGAAQPPAVAVPAEPVRRTPATVQAQTAPAAVPVAVGQPEDFHLILMELTIQLVYATARVDGTVARNERQLIERHLERRWAYDPVLLNRARAYCAQYETQALDLDACLARVLSRCTPQLRQAIVELCWQVADATNGINKREAAFLESLSQRLGVPLPDVEPGWQPLREGEAPVEPSPGLVGRIANPAYGTQRGPDCQSGLQDHRAVLEIDAKQALTAELVRRQYNLLHDRYAPEKVQGMGSDFVAMAEGKRTAIRVAVLALLEPLGEKLETTTAEPQPQALRHNPDLDALFGV